MREPGFGPGPSVAHSPTFNGRSSGTLAEIAARVVNEFTHHHQNDTVSYSSTLNDAFPQPKPHPYLLPQNVVVGFDTKTQTSEPHQENDVVVDYLSDFEFPVPGIGENPSPISADEIFLNGQIRPLFPQPRSPAPGRNPNQNPNPNPKSPARSPIRMPLKKLMISERETSLTDQSLSCSSSDADELEGAAAGTYCVWNPNKKKKIKSAGSSKRWNFPGLLYRSQSFRGGDLVDVLDSKSKKKKKKADGGSGRNRKTAYLVGMLANINGLSRAVRPF